MTRGFIPKHGGYKKLLSYQKAEIVYDATVSFCARFIDRHSRTHDQMVQAARSGKQNIIEGSMASATSKETEIKLTNVARASLEELLADYRDFLRVRALPEWPTEHAYARRLRELNKIPDASYETFRKGIEHPDPAIEKYPIRFDLNIMRCVFCGLCVEACPVDAIRMDTGKYELADESRDRLVYDLDFLLNR